MLLDSCSNRIWKIQIHKSEIGIVCMMMLLLNFIIRISWLLFWFVLNEFYDFAFEFYCELACILFIVGMLKRYSGHPDSILFYTCGIQGIY